MEKIVEFSHVSVEFPGVRANDDVSFSVNKGEIFALVGENGAGKIHPDERPVRHPYPCLRGGVREGRKGHEI